MNPDIQLMRMEKLKGSTHVLVASKHNKRTMYADCTPGRDIDSSRSHLNRVLAGPESPAEVAEKWKERLAESGFLKLPRKDSVAAIEVVFSLRADAHVDVMRGRRQLSWPPGDNYLGR